MNKTLSNVLLILGALLVMFGDCLGDHWSLVAWISGAVMVLVGVFCSKDVDIIDVTIDGDDDE